MFEVLVFVYQNYWRDAACPEPAQLERKLHAVGFDGDEIEDALTWLGELDLAARGLQQAPTKEPASSAVPLATAPALTGMTLKAAPENESLARSPSFPSSLPCTGAGREMSRGPTFTSAQSAHSMRIYTMAEQAQLGPPCLGFVQFLENAGVLAPPVREVVLDRAMATPGGPLPLDDLKLIILMVFWSLGQQPEALVLDELCDDSSNRLAH